MCLGLVSPFDQSKTISQSCTMRVWSEYVMRCCVPEAQLRSVATLLAAEGVCASGLEDE